MSEGRAAVDRDTAETECERVCEGELVSVHIYIYMCVCVGVGVFTIIIKTRKRRTRTTAYQDVAFSNWHQAAEPILSQVPALRQRCYMHSDILRAKGGRESALEPSESNKTKETNNGYMCTCACHSSMVLQAHTSALSCTKVKTKEDNWK